jgi:hypothetical protein
MLTKPLLAIVLAACGVPSNTASAPPDPPADQDKPPEVRQEEQHWCCQSVDHKGKTGDGCSAISGTLEVINSCANVLYCPGFWTKENGNVVCG